MTIHIKIIGLLLIILSFVHIVFPKYFNWKNELSNLSLINRQMMVIHTLFIALVLFMMGLLCLSSSVELTSSNLGKRICLGFSFFWFCRLFIQFFGYSSELWKGKRFETLVHVVFSFLWAYMSLVFMIASLGL